MSIHQAIILVGGLGTRLGDLTRATPKPMLDVGGRPFVEHVIAHLARFGLTDIVLLAGYRGDAFVHAYAGRQMFGARISVLVEPEPCGTGGALKFAAGRLDPVFVMTNGDTFFEADLLPLLRPATGTSGIGGSGANIMLVRQIGDASRYGRVVLGAGGDVQAFQEKVAGGGAGGGSALINAGCYRLNRDEVLGRIGTLPCSFESHVLPALLKAGQLFGLQADGYFIDMGLPESLATARDELMEVRRRPAAFLDRDGVINIDHGYTHRIEDLVFVDGAATAIRALNAAGYYTIVVSNQAGIARGYYNETQARAFNDRMRAGLMADGARLDAVYFCPHHPLGTVERYAIDCACRKPAAGLLEHAARDWPIDAGRSFLIGDKATDIEAASRFGIPGYSHTGGNLAATVEHALAAQRLSTQARSAQ